MAKEYKYLLDGTEFSDPIGWDESEKKITRVEKYRGIFVEYINKVVFTKDSYTYIKNKTEANGYCGSITVNIYVLRNLNYETYFEGIIKLSEVTINESRCTIECSIEDANLTSLINNLGSTKVLFNRTSTITGQPLSTVGYTCNAHKGTNTTTGVVHDQSRTMYKVFDSFQYILNYISDNRITFASDLFSTEVSVLIPPTFNSSILFTNPGVDLVGAGNVIITYTNAFDETFIVTVPKQGTVAATLNYIISQLNFNSSGSIRDKFYTQDWRYFPKAVSNGTDTITITGHIRGFTIDSVTGASASLGQALPEIPDEFGSLSICCGNELRGVDLMKATLTSEFADVAIAKVPEISFDELWEEMNKCFNLGMSLSYISGVLTLRIERFDYFLSQTQSISLTGVENLSYKISDQYTFTSVSVGDGSKNIANKGTQNTNDKWISSVECFEREANLKNAWIIDSAQIDQQIRLRPASVSTATRNAISSPDLYEGLVIYNTDTDELNVAIDNVGGAGSWVIADPNYLNSIDDNDSDIFIIECFDALSNGTVRTSYFENRIYSNTSASYVQWWAYNANIMNYNKIFSWMYLIMGSPRLGNYILENTTNNPLLKEFFFECPISLTNENTILSDVKKFIRFNTGADSTTGRAGWINEISRNNKTGMANIKLIGNS